MLEFLYGSFLWEDLFLGCDMPPAYHLPIPRQVLAYAGLAFEQMVVNHDDDTAALFRSNARKELETLVGKPARAGPYTT
jgi:hypothetical protein